MSIFGKIKVAIFSHQATTPAPQAQGAAMPQMGDAPTQAARFQAPVQQQPVDVAVVLTDIASKKGQQLNWRTSIVDLMKLLDMDPSLDNRKELAT